MAKETGILKKLGIGIILGAVALGNAGCRSTMDCTDSFLTGLGSLVFPDPPSPSNSQKGYSPVFRGYGGGEMVWYQVFPPTGRHHH